MVQDEQRTVEQLSEEADIAADYLEGLLDIADYDGDIEMGVQNYRPVVQIVADDDTDIKHLIGEHGEVVDALQQLTRLAVQQKTGERSHLILDVDGYLKHKKQALKELASEAIEAVSSTGHAIDLKPMNSFERKVIHDQVRDAGLKSRSHGEEPNRYVSVFDADDEEGNDAADESEDVPTVRDARNGVGAGGTRGADGTDDVHADDASTNVSGNGTDAQPVQNAADSASNVVRGAESSNVRNVYDKPDEAHVAVPVTGDATTSHHSAISKDDTRQDSDDSESGSMNATSQESPSPRSIAASPKAGKASQTRQPRKRRQAGA